MESIAMLAFTSVSTQYEWKIWIVVVAYLIFTTWFGHKLSGRQATIKDFFLGGRKLPWWAVSGSVIATEISAMTLVGVPAFLWAETGDMAYMVLAIGSILSRIVVGYFFVPAYYEQEIYSPYEYTGNKLGTRAQKVTSTLFMIGGSLGQGTRVLLTAMVIQVMTGLNIYVCIWLTGLVAVLWTFMGGIVTVVWTDVIQFLIFFFSAIVSLVTIGTILMSNGVSLDTMISQAYDAGKFHWFNWDIDPRQTYTIWTALIATTIGCLFSYGVDQMMVQRCFCCKGPKEARKAIIWSSVSQIIMITCLLVGVGLWYFYKKSGIPGVPTPEESGLIGSNVNNALPVFIRFRISWWIGGIVVAGIFAAAVSSMDSILAALAEQSLSIMKNYGYKVKNDRQAIGMSRIIICFWGVILCVVASLFWYAWQGDGLIIELALSVVGLTAGGILGVFIMALVPKLRRESYGMEYSAAISMMTIFAFMQHPDFEEGKLWPLLAMGTATLVILAAASIFRIKKDPWVLVKMLPFLGLVYYIQLFRFPDPATGRLVNVNVGWTWYSFTGLIMMLAASRILCKPLPQDKHL